MISTADLQDWMKAEDVDAPVLRVLEESAVQAVQNLTGHYYGVTTTLTEIIRFRSVSQFSNQCWPLQLNNEPVGGAITSLEQWDGAAWTLIPATNYYVDGSLIWPNATYTWPLSYLMYQFPLMPVRFRAIYSAGYTVDPNDADVWPAPADIQMAVRGCVAYWFEHREEEGQMPQWIKDSLSDNRRVSV